MTATSPTPSRKAVILKKSLAACGYDIPLSVIQEVLARAEGYDSWNAYVGIVPSRGAKSMPTPVVTQNCKKCGSQFTDIYCSNDNCRFSDWTQDVPEDVFNEDGYSDAKIEFMFNVDKRDREKNPIFCDGGQLTIRGLYRRRKDLEEKRRQCDEELEQLERELVAILDATGALAGYKRVSKYEFGSEKVVVSSISDYCYVGDEPEIKLYYELVHHHGYRTRLTLALSWRKWRATVELKRVTGLKKPIPGKIRSGHLSLNPFGGWDKLVDELLPPDNAKLSEVIGKVLAKADEKKGFLLCNVNDVF